MLDAIAVRVRDSEREKIAKDQEIRISEDVLPVDVTRVAWILVDSLLGVAFCRVKRVVSNDRSEAVAVGKGEKFFVLELEHVRSFKGELMSTYGEPVGLIAHSFVDGLLRRCKYIAKK